jgi:DNA-binding transcriptional regulator GbsR (MarR family)
MLGHRKNSPKCYLNGTKKRYRSYYYTYNLKQRLISSMWLLCRKKKSKKRQWFLVHEDVKEMEMQVVVHEPMEEVHIVQEVMDEAMEKVQGDEQVVELQKNVKHVVRKKLTQKNM